MPPSNQPEPPGGQPAGRRKPTRLRLAAISALLALPIVAGVLGDELARSLPSPTSPAAILAIAGSMSLIAYLIARLPDRANPSEGESGRRLNQAEVALADALRRPPAEENGTAVPRPRADDEPGVTPVEDASHRRSLLGLPELWEATHARLDLYHQIATGQARTSFRNAQTAMIAGFVLLVLFSRPNIAVWASSTAVAIVATGSAPCQPHSQDYVAKTFIRSQEAAATHLRSYFDQPLELSRYLAAERLVADGDLSQEQRGEILSALVQAMVVGPQPAPRATGRRRHFPAGAARGVTGGRDAGWRGRPAAGRAADRRGLNGPYVHHHRKRVQVGDGVGVGSVGSAGGGGGAGGGGRLLRGVRGRRVGGRAVGGGGRAGGARGGGGGGLVRSGGAGARGARRPRVFGAVVRRGGVRAGARGRPAPGARGGIAGARRRTVPWARPRSGRPGRRVRTRRRSRPGRAPWPAPSGPARPPRAAARGPRTARSGRVGGGRPAPPAVVRRGGGGVRRGGVGTCAGWRGGTGAGRRGRRPGKRCRTRRSHRPARGR